MGMGEARERVASLRAAAHRRRAGMIAHAVLASTAYDIGRAVGYVIVPVIIGAIILLIARSQNRSTSPGPPPSQRAPRPLAGTTTRGTRRGCATGTAPPGPGTWPSSRAGASVFGVIRSGRSPARLTRRFSIRFERADVCCHCLRRGARPGRAIALCG